MNKKELISIILPVYNGEKYLAEAIESILNQTYANFELLIINDCSTDSTLDIATAFAETDKRIKIINNLINKKLPASLNIGHKAAKGNYITWTSDDNILKPNFLKSLLESIKKENTAIVFSNFDIINSDGSFKREHKTENSVNLLFGNVIGASFLYKKDVFTQLKGYNEKLFLVEDYDFWIRASLKFKIKHLNKNLYKYRIHNYSLTNNIEKDVNTKATYVNGIDSIFRNIARELNWSYATTTLIRSFHSKNTESFKIYLKNKKIILKDLEIYTKKTQNSDDIKLKLWLLLRSSLKNNTSQQSIINLFKILVKQPQILLSSRYSKKQTILLIFKCFKRLK